MAASILDRCIKTLGPASTVQTFQHNHKISWSLHLQIFFLNCHMLEFLYSNNVRTVFFEFHLSRS